MGRVIGRLLVTSALLAGVSAAQTVAGGNTAGPSAANPQVLLNVPAPPNAALPGSGTPTGTVPDLGINNPLQNVGGAVYQPGVSGYEVGGVPVSNEQYLISTPTTNVPNAIAPAAASETAASPGTAAAVSSVYGYASANGAALTSGGKSLAEIAERYHPRPSQNAANSKRVFANGDIYALAQKDTGLPKNGSASEALPQNDQGPEAAQANDSNKAADVLDARDLAEVEAAIARSRQVAPNSQATELAQNQPSSSGGQTAQPALPQNDNADTNAPNSTAATSSTDQNGEPTRESAKRLPQTGTELPLMALMGFGALSAGAYAVRKFTRRS